MNQSVISINQFQGLNTDDDPIWIRDGQSPSAQNVNTDDSIGLAPRKGYTIFSTISVNQCWTFSHTNGTKYLIVRSSNTLFADTGDGSFGINMGTVSQSVLTSGAQLGDRFYFSNEVDGLFYTAGSAIVYSSRTLTFPYIASFKGRLWGTGLAGDKRNIYVSQYLVGDNFLLDVDPIETSPTRVPVQGSLDEGLKGFYSGFQDLFIWFKPHSFGGIYGSRRTNFQSKLFSDSVGTNNPESAQNCNGALQFKDTKNRYWKFDGATLKKISEDIDNLTNTSVSGGSSVRQNITTSLTDWGSGTFGTNVSSRITEGDITYSFYLPDDGFDDNEINNNPKWTIIQGSANANSGALKSSNPNNTFIVTTKSNVSQGTWTIKAGDLRKTFGTTDFRFMVQHDDAISVLNGYFLNVVNDGSNLYVITLKTIKNNVESGGSCGSTPLDVAIPAEFKISRTTAGVFVVRYLDNSGNYSLVCSMTETSFSSATFMDVAALGVQPSASPYDYTLDSITTSWKTQGTYLQSSTYATNTINVGGAASSWKSFQSNYNTDGGSVTFALYSSTQTPINIQDNSTFSSSQTIQNNAQPTIAIHQYAVISTSFSRSNSSMTPSVQDFTLVWNDTTTFLNPSIWSNNRYWNSVAVSSAGNNRVWVYDKRQNWQEYTIPINDLVLYNDQLYFGNNNGFFTGETGNTDNGSPIASFWKTKSFILGNMDFHKYFDHLYISAANSADTLQSVYFVDGSNTSKNLTSQVMNGQSGMQNFNLAFPMSQTNQGKEISFQWTVNGTKAWNLLSANLYYQSEREPND